MKRSRVIGMLVATLAGLTWQAHGDAACPELRETKKIQGQFAEFWLMRTEAQGDQCRRAVAVIDYVWDTPNGSAFEVDNGDPPPFAAIVTKRDNTKVWKALEFKTDEDQLIVYHARVAQYGNPYLSMRQALLQRGVDLKQAYASLEALTRKFPKTSPIRTSMGFVRLMDKQYEPARSDFKIASDMNSGDSAAFAGLSTANVMLKDLGSAGKALDAAIAADPRQRFYGTREMFLLEELNPEAYNLWRQFIIRQIK